MVQYKREGVERLELIALWDRIPADGNDEGGCGTAAVVGYKLEGVERLLHFESDAALRQVPLEPGLLEPSECGPVHHIWTRRRGREVIGGLLFEPETLLPPAWGTKLRVEKYYEAIFALIDKFNGESKPPNPGKRDLLVPERYQKELADHELAIQERYAVADAIAISYQQQLQRTRNLVYWLVFLGSVCFGAFAHLSQLLEGILPRWPVLLVLTMVAWFIAFILHQQAKHADLQDRYQDYRALAEGLRVQFFWCVAGIRESVANHYFGKHRTELDWIRNALRNWRTTTQRTERAEGEILLSLVLDHWVKNQSNYFKARHEGHRREHSEKDKLVHVLLGTAIGIGVVLLFVVTIPHEWVMSHIIGVGLLVPIFAAPLEWARDILIFLIGICLVGAGVLHHYKEQMAFSEHEKHYGRVALTFSRAAELIEKALRDEQNVDKARWLLQDTGVAALEEHGDWVMLHRQRPLEVPPLA